MKRFMILVLCLGLIISSGCWSRAEIDQLAFVMSIGVDKGINKEYLISLKIAKPAPKSSEGGNYSASKYLIYTFDVDTASEASEQLYKVLDKAPFWGQTRVVVISEEVAREGVSRILDFVSRNYRLRRNVNLLVTREKVYKIFDVDMSGGSNSALNVSTRIKNLNRTNVTELVTVGNFLSKLAAGKIQPVIPEERLLSKNETDIQFPKKQEEVAIQNLAVFKGDSLVGWLNEDETKGYMFTTGKSRSSRLDVRIKDKGYIMNFLPEQKISKKVEIVDGQPVIKLKYTGQAYQIETDTYNGEVLPKDWEDFSVSFQHAGEQMVVDYINQAVNKAKELDSDIFGFGQLIFRDKPELWRQIEPKWDETFHNLKVEVEAEITHKRAGATTSPPFKSKEERNIPIVE